MPERRFPAPSTIEDLGSCFVVKDSNGQKLGYFHYEEEPGRRSAARMQTRDEARQIAGNGCELFSSEANSSASDSPLQSAQRTNDACTVAVTKTQHRSDCRSAIRYELAFPEHPSRTKA